MPVHDVRRVRADAHGLARVVQVLELPEAVGLRSLDERAVEGAGIVRVRGRRAERAARSLEEGSDVRVRPLRAPLVVVGGRALDDHAGVDGRGSSEHPSAQRAAVLGSRLPQVGRNDAAGIEDLRRPAPLGEPTVVGAGLEEANAARRALAQARGEDASGGAAADHEDVEAHCGRLLRGVLEVRDERAAPLELPGKTARRRRRSSRPAARCRRARSPR